MAPRGKVTKKPAKKSAKKANPLFRSTPRSFRIGGAIRPAGRDLSRYVRWPKYVRVQRQRKVLYQRLKVPPAINQFSKTLDKNQATEVFKLLTKYTPETKQDKKVRIRGLAEAKANGESVQQGKPGPVIKYGLKHVTTLIESGKAQLVVIAHDVNPIELVIWLPALCRKMGVPFCIVKGKGRLGTLVHQKNAAVLCLTEVNKEDKHKLESLRTSFTETFNNTVERKWGGGIMGLKTQKRLEIRDKALAAEAAKKAALL